MNRVHHFLPLFQLRLWPQAGLSRWALFVPSTLGPNPVAPHSHRHSTTDTRRTAARSFVGFFYGKNQREPGT